MNAVYESDQRANSPVSDQTARKQMYTWNHSWRNTQWIKGSWLIGLRLGKYIIHHHPISPSSKTAIQYSHQVSSPLKHSKTKQHRHCGLACVFPQSVLSGSYGALLCRFEPRQPQDQTDRFSQIMRSLSCIGIDNVSEKKHANRVICLEWTEMKWEVLMVSHINLPIFMLMNNFEHCVCVCVCVCVCEPLKFTHPAGQILIWSTKLETPGTHVWNNIYLNVRTCMTLQMRKWYDLLKKLFYRHIAVTS